MTHTLDAVALPEELVWRDEFKWTPVKQSIEYTLPGAQIIDSGVKLAGRPISLNDENAWVDYMTLNALYAKLQADSEMVLTLIDGRVFNVRFDHQNTPLTATPVIDYNHPDNNDFYRLSLKFITV